MMQLKLNIVIFQKSINIDTCYIPYSMFKAILLSTIIALSMCSSVEEINKEYLDQIKTAKKIWLVYETTDISSPNSQILHDVSDILAGFFKIGVWKGSEDSLQLYADDGQVIDYNGKFQVEDIVNFVLTNTNQVIKSRSKIANDVKANKQFLQKQAQRATKQWNGEQELRKKSDTVVLDTKNWESSFLKQRQPYFINFYEANCSACIQLNKQWQAVATSLKGKAKVAKINVTQEESLESQFQITNFPSIRFYPVGTKKVDSFTEFTGTKRKFSILQWANLQLSSKESSVDIAELNKQNYKTMCKDSKSTCIIMFVDEPSQVQQKIGQLASKYLKKPISFLVSKKGSQPEFEKQAGVESAPQTIMMYCKGNKMLRMGGMDFTVIDETINEITLGNRNNFVKYKFEENLQ